MKIIRCQKEFKRAARRMHWKRTTCRSMHPLLFRNDARIVSHGRARPPACPPAWRRSSVRTSSRARDATPDGTDQARRSRRPHPSPRPAPSSGVVAGASLPLPTLVRLLNPMLSHSTGDCPLHLLCGSILYQFFEKCARKRAAESTTFVFWSLVFGSGRASGCGHLHAEAQSGV